MIFRRSARAWRKLWGGVLLGAGSAARAAGVGKSHKRPSREGSRPEDVLGLCGL